jgi:MOSC domain-containing protein YiiM
MYLLSIQVASPQLLTVGRRQISTGIFKVPVAEATVGPLGLEGDAVMNAKHHGGPDQAVYVYSQEDYGWWVDQVEHDIFPGVFGENLTLSSFGVGDVMVGDRWQMGEVVLEATAPRLPCATFASRMGDPTMVNRFREARRPGFYARVITPGEIGVGGKASRVPSAHSVSIAQLFDLAYNTDAGVDELRRALAAPIAERARGDLQRRLDKTV